MPVIELETIIKADIETCFDLARNIDLHQISTAKTNEKAIAGKISGLINLNDWVTWQARHFGITQRLTSKITAFNRPFHFKDEQIKGSFKYFSHNHYFKKENGFVIMKDVFEFKSPFGIAGKLFNSLVLKNYMQRLLVERNEVIKKYAENNLSL